MWLAWETRMVSLKGLNFAFNRVQTLSFCWELWHFGLSPRSSVSSMSSGAQAVRLGKEGATEHSLETAMNAAFCSFIRQLEQFCIFILFSCDPMVLIRVVYGSTQLTIAYTAEENVCPPPLNHCPHGSPQGGWVPEGGSLESLPPPQQEQPCAEMITAGATAPVPQLRRAIPDAFSQCSWKLIGSLNIQLPYWC